MYIYVYIYIYMWSMVRWPCTEDSVSQQQILSSTNCIETGAQAKHKLRQDSVQMPFEASSANFHKLKPDLILCFHFPWHVFTCFEFCPCQDDHRKCQNFGKVEEATNNNTNRVQVSTTNLQQYRRLSAVSVHGVHGVQGVHGHGVLAISGRRCAHDL